MYDLAWQFFMLVTNIMETKLICCVKYGFPQYNEKKVENEVYFKLQVNTQRA